jgi:DNA polymerase-1
MPTPATPHALVLRPEHVVAYDCETHLIAPGMLAPPMVCVSFAGCGPRGRAPSELRHRLEREHIVEGVHTMHAASSAYIVGANTAFDACVMMNYDERLILPILLAYEEGRVLDVQICEQLADIARGRLGGSTDGHGKYSNRSYSLAALALRHLGKDRSHDKSDPNGWRLRYSELHDWPLVTWPEAAKAYAIEDADDTLDVFLKLLPDTVWHPDAAAQARAALALHMLSCHGIMTDADAINALEEATAGRFGDLTRELTAEGLIRSNGVRDTKLAKKRIIAAYRANGIPVPLTDTGAKLLISTMKIEQDPGGSLEGASREVLAASRAVLVEVLGEDYPSLDEEACDGSNDPLLVKYAERTRLQTIVKTHIPDLRNGLVTPIQARWGLAESGRVTCSKGKGGALYGYQLTNPLRSLVLTCPVCGGDGEKDSGAYVSPECGYCKGKGEYTGPGIRECFRARPGFVLVDADFSGLELCTVAQVCRVLVGWSDMGDALNAGLDVHLDFGAQMLGITYEEAYRRRHDKDVKEARQLAKVANFGFPGGLGAAGFVAFARGYGIKYLTAERAKELKAAWLLRWTEFVPYFEHIGDLCRDSGVAEIVQLYSHRTRGLVPYTAACNTYFQGLGADGAKAALWDVTLRCYGDEISPLYGCRPVNFVHDQILMEAPIDRAHEAAVELGRVMVEACNRYLPDVPVKCEPCLSYAWHKDAVAVYSYGGYLIPWDEAKRLQSECYYADESRVVW